MADRILGMGDVLSLIEQAERTMDKDVATKGAAAMIEGRFTLEDFLEQLQQVKKMGSVSGMLSLLPGVPKDLKQASSADRRPPDRPDRGHHPVDDPDGAGRSGHHRRRPPGPDRQRQRHGHLRRQRPPQAVQGDAEDDEGHWARAAWPAPWAGSVACSAGADPSCPPRPWPRWPRWARRGDLAGLAGTGRPTGGALGAGAGAGAGPGRVRCAGAPSQVEGQGREEGQGRRAGHPQGPLSRQFGTVRPTSSFTAQSRRPIGPMCTRRPAIGGRLSGAIDRMQRSSPWQ